MVFHCKGFFYFKTILEQKLGKSGMGLALSITEPRNLFAYILAQFNTAELSRQYELYVRITYIFTQPKI